MLASKPCFLLSVLFSTLYSSDTRFIFIVESIPHKLEPNEAHKNTFYFYASARNRAPIFPDHAPTFYEWKMSILVSKSCSNFSNRAPILTASTNFNFFNFESLWIQKIIGIQPFLKCRNGNSRKSMYTIFLMGLKNSVVQSPIKCKRDMLI